MKKPSDALPPHSPESELACLGVLVAEPDAAAARLAGLGSALFYDTLNRAAFGAIASIVSSGGIPDTIALFQHRPADVDRAAWAAFVGGLPEKCSTTLAFPQFVSDLRQAAGRRALLQLAEQAKSFAMDPAVDGASLPQQFAEQADAIIARLGNAKGLPDFEDAYSYSSTPIELPPELVRGLIHKGTKVAIGGCSKSHKTWLLCDLAVSVASGAPWWGFDAEQGRVLYLNFEIPKPFFAKRINTILDAKGLRLTPGALQVWNLRGYAADIDELESKIISRIQDEGFSLCIVDPLYKCIGARDENSASDVAGLMNAFERIATKSGATIAMAGHYAKGLASSKDAIDRISGSGVFARDPDSIIPVTKHEVDGAFVIEPILRNLAPVSPFVVKWEFPLMVRDDSLDPSKLKKAAGRKASYSVDDVVKALGSQTLEYKEWRDQCLDFMSEATFKRLISQANSSGLVFKSKVNGKWSKNHV